MEPTGLEPLTPCLQSGGVGLIERPLRLASREYCTSLLQVRYRRGPVAESRRGVPAFQVRQRSLRVVPLLRCRPECRVGQASADGREHWQLRLEMRLNGSEPCYGSSPFCRPSRSRTSARSLLVSSIAMRFAVRSSKATARVWCDVDDATSHNGKNHRRYAEQDDGTAQTRQRNIREAIHRRDLRCSCRRRSSSDHPNGLAVSLERPNKPTTAATP